MSNRKTFLMGLVTNELSHPDTVVTKVVRHSWEGEEIGSVKFLSASWIKLIYFGDVFILPLSLPLSDSDGRTTSHPDNWKYSTIGRWLVSGEEV